MLLPCYNGAEIGKHKNSGGFIVKAWEGVAALCRKPGEPRLLMVLQGKPGQPPAWALPGGELVGEEKPEKAVVREALEDTGVKVQVVRLYRKQQGKTEDARRQPYEFVSHYYEVKPADVKLHPQDPSEQTYRAEWISADQIEDLGLLYEYQREVILSFWSEAAGRAA